MSQLSTYGTSGLASDAVAKQFRRLNDNRVINVRDYLSEAQITDVNTGALTLDCSAAIQAAIDAAYSSGASTVYIPAGRYRIDTSIWVDHPSNLRVTYPTAAYFGYPIAVVGSPQGSNGGGRGTEIYAADNCASGVTGAPTGVAIWLGTQNGTLISHINVVCRNGSGKKEKERPLNSAGFAIASGSGGASRTTLEHCHVEQFYFGFVTGLNGTDALADSNKFYNCQALYCRYGWAFLRSQNYINDLISCTSNYCNTAVAGGVPDNDVKVYPGVRVIGGNISASGSGTASFTISSVGSTTSFTDTDGYTNFQIPLTLNMTALTAVTAAGPYPRYFRSLTARDGSTSAVFDIAVVKTASFGLVPLVWYSFNEASSIVTYKFHAPWLRSNVGVDPTDFLTRTDIIAEITAAAVVHCGDRCTNFVGPIAIYGCHVENYGVACFLKDYGGNWRSEVTNIFFNYDATCTNQGGAGTPSLYSQQYLQAAFGFMELQRRSSFRNITFSQTQPDGIKANNLLIDYFGQNEDQQPVFENISGIYSSFNIRGVVNLARNTGSEYGEAFSATMGIGYWDQNLFRPTANAKPRQWAQYGGRGNTPTMGRRPATWATPRLKPSHVTSMVAAPTSPTTIPIVTGDTIYSVSDGSTYAPYAFAKHIGPVGYTYGSDLTANWSYKGQSFVINITSNLDSFFPGLLATFDNGTFQIEAMVTEVHAATNHIVVARLNDGPSNYMDGTKTTTYTGSTVIQRRLNVKKYGRQCDFGSAAPTTGTWSVGDLVYNTVPATGQYVGWVCTVAGSPGTWKQFGLIA